MNLNKLFVKQKELDKYIIKEKGLEGQDLLDKKILALQVELGELANEWQMFKFWKEDNKPKRAYNKGCDNCVGGISKLSPLFGPYKECEICRVNPLLEEYVDCLHFILSIGLELEMQNTDNWFVESNVSVFQYSSITEQFIFINQSLGDLYQDDYQFEDLLYELLGLGEMLGFTWEEVEQAYYAKNKENHERQENGY